MKTAKKIGPPFLAACLVLCALVLIVAYAGRQATTASTSELSRRIIVIDPGHGGEDGGTSTADGVRESGVNLAISQRLRLMLALCGQPTRMIRQTDTAVYTEGRTIAEKKVSDIRNRAALIAETPGALLVSIHQNFFEQPKYSGAQVFYAATDGSQQLAEAAQSLLKSAVDPGNNRQAKPCDKRVYLMHTLRCTGILVECGFLSNPDEAARLQTPDYQKKLVIALTGALVGYLTQEQGSDPLEI